ncbi:MAG: hypothetical protein Q9159_006217 [Coniocarpon cinnabarinum]
MTNPLQKRKNTQSSLNNPRSRSRYRSVARKSRSTVRANPVLAKHWDHSLTPSQNYENLGFVKKLNRLVDPRSDAAQGVKRKGENDGLLEYGENFGVEEVQEIMGDEKEQGPAIGEMKVVRDKDGKILRIAQESNPRKAEISHQGTQAEETWKVARPEDGLADADPQTHTGEKSRRSANRLVEKLEDTAAEYSRGPSAAGARRLSPREREWCTAMVAKHGAEASGDNDGHIKFDWDAMCRDRKMNVMQLSRGQMRQKIKRFLASQGKNAIEIDA